MKTVTHVESYVKISRCVENVYVRHVENHIENHVEVPKKTPSHFMARVEIERQISFFSFGFAHVSEVRHMLKNIVIQQDQMIKTLKEQQSSAYQCEIRSNLMIYGLDQAGDENHESLKSAVETFFKEKMEIEETIEISDVYRIGKAVPPTVMVEVFQ